MTTDSYSSINEVSSTLGGRVGKVYKLKNGIIFAPEAHASYEYFWIADRLQTSNVLAEADTESEDGERVHFVLFGNDPSKHQFTTGLDFQMQKDDKLSLDASYVYGFNGFESNHAVAAKVVYGL